MSTLSRTGIAGVVCLAIAAGALAQAPESRMDRDEVPARQRMPEMRGAAGGPMGGMGEEQSRESMLARFVTDEATAKKLGLTEEQVKHLKARSVELRKAAIRLKAEQELAGMAQVELLSADELDEAAIMAAVEKTGHIRTEIAKLQILPIIELKKTLTPQQLDQAKRMLHERMRQRVHAQSGKDQPQGEGPEWRRPPRGEAPAGDRERERRRPPRNPEGDSAPEDGPPPMGPDGEE